MNHDLNKKITLQSTSITVWSWRQGALKNPDLLWSSKICCCWFLLGSYFLGGGA